MGINTEPVVLTIHYSTFKHACTKYGMYRDLEQYID